MNPKGAYKERSLLILRQLCRSYAKTNAHVGPKKTQDQTAEMYAYMYFYEPPPDMKQRGIRVTYMFRTTNAITAMFDPALRHEFYSNFLKFILCVVIHNNDFQTPYQMYFFPLKIQKKNY